MNTGGIRQYKLISSRVLVPYYFSYTAEQENALTIFHGNSCDPTQILLFRVRAEQNVCTRFEVLSAVNPAGYLTTPF
jgi:hypothetical protein